MGIEFVNHYKGLRVNNGDNTIALIKEILIDYGYCLGHINVVFMDDDSLLDLNRHYLKHDTFTDIITFDYTEDKNIHGELCVSIDRVVDNAEIYQCSFYTELCRVIIHGVLHLCGLKDKTEREKEKMMEQEEYYLNKLNGHRKKAFELANIN